MKNVITLLLFFTILSCKKEESEKIFTCQQCLITTSKYSSTTNCGNQGTYLTTKSMLDSWIKNYNHTINYPDGSKREFRMSCSETN